MNLGQVFADADGQHPHAVNSYVGRSILQAAPGNSFDDPSTLQVAWHSIMVAAPLSMHRQVFERRAPARAAVSLVPWSESSGLGLLVVNAVADVVLAILDIAGRTDLTELQLAARQDKLAVGIASDADAGVTPLLPVSGFADALSEARTLRRLSARELAEAITEVRLILRGPAAYSLLGIPMTGTRLDTLTVNACTL